MAEICKHLGVPGLTTLHADTEPLTTVHLHRSLSTLVVCNHANNDRMQKTTKRGLLQGSGKIRSHQTQTNTDLCLLSAWTALELICFQASEFANPPGEYNTLFGREPHIIAQWGSWLHPLWTKLVAKHTQGIFPLCLGGRGAGSDKTQSCKSPLMWGWGDSAATIGKARRCLGETESKLKLTVSPREKLVSNSQACPMNGRSWGLLIYKPLTGLLLWICLLQRLHPLQPGLKHPELSPNPPSCPIGRSSTHCHSMQHTKLGKGKSWPKPL
jgi:hypothetical protein